MSQKSSNQIQILHKESALFSGETFPVKEQQIKFETLCKQEAAKLIFFLPFLMQNWTKNLYG